MLKCVILFLMMILLPVAGYCDAMTSNVGGTVKSGQAVRANKVTTTVQGTTSGNVVFSEPFLVAPYRRVLARINTLIGSASYTFPVPFPSTPTIIGDAASIPQVTSISKTAITITGVNSVKTYYNAAQLSGSNDIDLGNNASLSFDVGTITWWMPNKGSNGVNYIWCRNPGSDTWGKFGILYYSGNLCISGCGSAGQAIASYGAFANGDFVALVFNYPYVDLYINGNHINQITYGNHFNCNSTNHTVIGQAGEYGSYRWNGSIEEVQLYNIALNSTQIGLIYNGGAGHGSYGIPSSLAPYAVSNWHFNTDAVDSVAGVNNGTWAYGGASYVTGVIASAWNYIDGFLEAYVYQ